MELDLPFSWIEPEFLPGLELCMTPTGSLLLLNKTCNLNLILKISHHKLH